jgi:hypothetical protein
MSVSRYLTMTVTQVKKRIVPNVRDKYGNDTYATTTVQLSGCLVEPRLTFGTENTAGQEHVGRGLDLFCIDVDADIQPTDRFIIDGDSYEVDGPTNRYHGSFLGNDYCHVNLERITG